MPRKTAGRISQKRRSNKRKKQKAFLKKAGFYSFLAAGILTAGIYFFFFSPYFQLEKIEVLNAKTVSAEEIKKIASEKYRFSVNILGMEIASNSIFLPVFNLAAVLEKFPQVEKLSLSREFPNVLALEVKERESFAVWCKDWEKKEECFWADKTGFLFKPYESKEQERDGELAIEEKENIEAALLGSNMEKKDFMLWAQKIKEKFGIMPETGGVKSFSIFSDKLALKTQKGFEIYFDLREDLEWQEQKLEAVLKEKISSGKIKASEYIDLRFGNQAIIK